MEIRAHSYNNPDAQGIYDILADWTNVTEPRRGLKRVANETSASRPGSGGVNYGSNFYRHCQVEFETDMGDSVMNTLLFSSYDEGFCKEGTIILDQDGYELRLDVSLDPYGGSASDLRMITDDLVNLDDSRNENFDQLADTLHDPFCRRLLLQLIDSTIIHPQQS